MSFRQQKQQGSTSLIFAIVFGLLFLLTTILAGWAYAGRQDYKNDVDQKVAAAVEVAVQQANTAKDAEFIEKEKLPFTTYSGPSTYGSLTFDYPKTWSIYEQQSSSGTVLEVYAHPSVLPGFQSQQPYALRVEILSTAYDTTIARLSSSIDSGRLRAQAFRPAQVQDVLGTRVDGEVSQTTTQGAGVYLPLRDRTIYVYTESSQFVSDFTGTILSTLSFNP